MNIYVGNLATESGEADLRTAFGAFGDVSSAIIIKDKISGTPRGFAFVKMASETEGTAAIAGLHGTILQGNMLNVNVARARE